MRHPFVFVVPFVLALAVGMPEARADYTPRPVAQLAPGNYLLRLRMTTFDRAAAPARLVRAVPVVVGVRGNVIGLGGKWGPQVTGSLANGSLNVSGPIAGGVVFSLTGAGGGAQGRFTMTGNGSTVGGEYLLDPAVTGAPGQTLAGVGTTSGFTNMTPAPAGAVGGPSVAGLGGKGNGPAYGGGFTGPAAGTFGSSTTGSAPGMAGAGPNFGGSTLSGFEADGDPSPMTPINPSTAGGPKATSGAGTGPAPTPKEPGQYGAKSADKATTTWADAAVSGMKSLGCGLGISSCPPSGGKTDGGNGKPDAGSGGSKECNPNNDGSHNAGTAGSTLNRPGAGTDKGGGGGSSGGTSGANGATLNTGVRGGDNPFEVTPADVLNKNHLVNFASDPAPGVGASSVKTIAH